MAPVKEVKTMGPNGAGKQQTAKARAEALAQKQTILEDLAARRLQRALRGNSIRRVLADIALFEDKVLGQPMTGSYALNYLMNTQKQAFRPVGAAIMAVGFLRKANFAVKAAKAGGKMQQTVAATEASEAALVPEDADEETADLEPTADDADPDCKVVTKKILADRLLKGGAVKTEIRAAVVASSILRLLRTPFLDEPELQQIFRHHKVRRRNAASTCYLMLTLVQHGDSDHSKGAHDQGDFDRPMLPEGWVQVSRTAWNLLSHPQWSPEFFFGGRSKRCVDTSQRLRSVLAEDRDPETDGAPAIPMPVLLAELDLPQLRPDPDPPTVSEAVFSVKKKGIDIKQNAATATGDVSFLEKQWTPLNFTPGQIATAISDHVHHVAGPVPDEFDGPYPPRPRPMMVVAGNRTLEMLLGFLTHGGGPSAIPVTGRLCGGDAVLLRSPAMAQLIGEDDNEHFRDSGELWDEALRRNKWTVIHQLRGDGKRAEPMAGVVADKKEVQVLPDKAVKNIQKWMDEPLGRIFRAEAGAPLVFSQEDFSTVAYKAGRTYFRIEHSLTLALGGCVRDYDPDKPPEDQLSEADSKDSKRSKGSMAARQSSSRKGKGRGKASKARRS